MQTEMNVASAIPSLPLTPQQGRLHVGAWSGDGFAESAGLTPPLARHGRGAATNRSGRFEHEARVTIDDGWGGLEEIEALRTEVTIERPKSIITRNDSPDLSFDRSINPYRGCEHGCVYCFARPTHAYMGLSPGLDFETRLFVKEIGRAHV